MKKINKRLIALGLVGLLLLTGCGESKENTDVSKENAGSVVNGTLKPDSTVIAIGNTSVSYSEYQAYSYILKSKYEGVVDNNIWNYSTTEGRTIGMDAIEDTIRLIIQLKVIGKYAESQGVTLGADEKEELSYDAEQYVKGLSQEIRDQYGITTQLVAEMLCDNEVARKVYDVITAKVDINISEEQAQVVETQVIYLMSKGTDRNGAQVNLNDEDKTALFNKAKELQTQAQSGGFYALAETNSSLNEIQMNIGREDTPKELVDVAFTMKAGQISPVISTDTGFYILNCVGVNRAEAMEQHRQELIEERQTKAFQDIYKTWADKIGVHVSRSLLK